MTKTLPRHPYERDEASGAGNCWCGYSRDSIVHPHAPVGSQVSDGMKCVCSKPWNHSIHGQPEGFEALLERSSLSEASLYVQCPTHGRQARDPFTNKCILCDG